MQNIQLTAVSLLRVKAICFTFPVNFGILSFFSFEVNFLPSLIHHLSSFSLLDWLQPISGLWIQGFILLFIICILFPVLPVQYSIILLLDFLHRAHTRCYDLIPFYRLSKMFFLTWNFMSYLSNDSNIIIFESQTFITYYNHSD